MKRIVLAGMLAVGAGVASAQAGGFLGVSIDNGRVYYDGGYQSGCVQGAPGYAYAAPYGGSYRYAPAPGYIYGDPYYPYRPHRELHRELRAEHRDLHADLRAEHRAQHEQLRHEAAHGVPSWELRAQHRAEHRELNAQHHDGHAELRDEHAAGHYYLGR